MKNWTLTKKIAMLLGMSWVLCLGSVALLLYRLSSIAEACILVLLATLLVVSIRVLRGINATLARAAGEISATARQISSAAAQVSSSSQGLAQGASESAAAVQQVSASLGEVGTRTHHNAEAANESARLMGDAQTTGGQVREAMDGMAVAVGEINDANGEIARVLRSIDDIAFQTNILALNAAVEAARAGESGAGFSIVADEVRNLAQRSAAAAKETAQLVERNGVSARCATDRMNAVRSTWAQSGNIRDQVKKMSDAIANGSAEQDRGLQEISRAVSQMDTATQQTAAHAEETASASEQLTAQASLLMSVAEEVFALAGTVRTSN